MNHIFLGSQVNLDSTVSVFAVVRFDIVEALSPVQTVGNSNSKVRVFNRQISQRSGNIVSASSYSPNRDLDIETMKQLFKTRIVRQVFEYGSEVPDPASRKQS
jgi:hypothetical protein